MKIPKKRDGLAHALTLKQAKALADKHNIRWKAHGRRHTYFFLYTDRPPVVTLGPADADTVHPTIVRHLLTLERNHG